LIVKQTKAKDLDTGMYPEDFAMDGKTPTPDKASNKKKKSKLTKNAKPPPIVTKNGSYYRAINTYFPQPMPLHLVKLGNNPDVQKIDSDTFLHSRHLGYPCRRVQQPGPSRSTLYCKE
jgi:hypothetical protein